MTGNVTAPCDDPQAEVLPELRTRRLVVVDAANRPVIEMGHRDGVASVEVLDLRGEPRMILALADDGSAVISLTHRGADGLLEDTVRITSANSEGEIVVRDDCFGNALVITSLGLKSVDLREQ